MKMLKRTFIMIAIAAFLASEANADDLCTLPVFMNVEAKVKKCYFGCEDFQVRANFTAQLGWKFNLDNLLKNPDWNVFFEAEDTIPGDGEFHELSLCVMVSKVKTARKIKLPPNSKPRIGSVTITYDPPEGDYFIEFKDCFYKKIEIHEIDCKDLDLIATKTTNGINRLDFNDMAVLAEKWLEI
jgi:hypothetical protein